MTDLTVEKVEALRAKVNALCDCWLAKHGPPDPRLAWLDARIAEIDAEIVARKLAAEAERLVAAHRSTPATECQHEWVSAKNEVIQNGEICLKCGGIRA